MVASLTSDGSLTSAAPDIPEDDIAEVDEETVVEQETQGVGAVAVAPQPVVSSTAPRRRICMFVYNNCAADVRVLKEAATLTAEGHEVQIVAVLDKRTTLKEERDGVQIVRIDRRPLHYKAFWTSRRVRRWLRLTMARTRRRIRVRQKAVARLLQRKSRGPVLAPAALPAGVVPARGFRTARTAHAVRTLGAPYRAVRWRAIRRVPTVRRWYYRRRSKGSALQRWRRRRHLRRHGAVQTAPGRRKFRLGTVLARGVLAVQRFFLSFLLLPLAIAALALRTFGRSATWLERRVTHLAYRAAMAFHKPLMFLDFYVRAFRLVRGQGFDIVHCHDLNTLPVGWALARRTAATLVYDAHELYPEISTLSRKERLVWRALERHMAPKAARIVTVCESIAEELVQRYRVAKPLVVHNCPPRSASPSPMPVNRLREKAGLLDHLEPLVLYQGGFAPNRGLETLIEAARDFHRGVLVLMGWGRIEDELRALIGELGLEKRALIVGPAEQHELLQFTQGADLGVIPYQPVGLNNYYTTPNKLFEYMASGIAVAGSRLPELQRFVEGYDFGVTFDPTQASDIARAVNVALEDDDRLAAMKSNALVASKMFAWESEVVKLVEAYDRLPTRSAA